MHYVLSMKITKNDWISSYLKRRYFIWWRLGNSLLCKVLYLLSNHADSSFVWSIQLQNSWLPNITEKISWSSQYCASFTSTCNKQTEFAIIRLFEKSILTQKKNSCTLVFLRTQSKIRGQNVTFLNFNSKGTWRKI